LIRANYIEGAALPSGIIIMSGKGAGKKEKRELRIHGHGTCETVYSQARGKDE